MPNIILFTVYLCINPILTSFFLILIEKRRCCVVGCMTALCYWRVDMFLVAWLNYAAPWLPCLQRYVLGANMMITVVSHKYLRMQQKILHVIY